MIVDVVVGMIVVMIIDVVVVMIVVVMIIDVVVQVLELVETFRTTLALTGADHTHSFQALALVRLDGSGDAACLEVIAFMHV